VTLADRSGMRCPRAAARHPRSRAARASACRHYDRCARCIAGSVDGSRRGNPPRGIRRTKPGPTLSLWDEESLWQEPWWNADGRAHLARCEPQPKRVRRIRISVFRRSAFLFFFSYSWLEALIVRMPVPPPVCSDEDRRGEQENSFRLNDDSDADRIARTGALAFSPSLPGLTRQSRLPWRCIAN
jgi:hypothetical protein